MEHPAEIPSIIDETMLNRFLQTGDDECICAEKAKLITGAGLETRV